jgi:hypothetical protein
MGISFFGKQFQNGKYYSGENLLTVALRDVKLVIIRFRNGCSAICFSKH